MFVELFKRLRHTGEDQPEVDYSHGMDAFRFVISLFVQSPWVENNAITFVYIPKRSYYENQISRAAADSEYEEIEEILHKHGFELLDTRRLLDSTDYYLYDGHWRESGHRKIAKALAKYIRRSQKPQK